MQDIHTDKLLIIDFGSQYTQLIARRIREIGIYCEIFPYDGDADFITEFSPKGVILSGGPDNITTQNPPQAPNIIFELGIPILGICYGMQTIAVQMGGVAVASDKAEYGFAQIRARGHSTLFKGIQDTNNEQGHGLLNVWMSHGIEVNRMPAGFQLIASSDNCKITGFANEDKKYYGIQFHPEVTHTKQGIQILERFAHKICNCEKNWTPKNIITDLKQKLKTQIRHNKVLLGLSGGVDSSVVAALLHSVIGDKLTCVFVDNGLLRLNEGDEVMQTFADNMGISVIRVNAQQRFYQVLLGEQNPEQKRKIIGAEFIAVFNDEALKIKAVDFLAQGTIYPDVIESAGNANGKAKVIKSHHNVGGLPDDIRFELVEPLRELFKDEVRKIGLELGLSYAMLYRHPFPGPGLGVRILGEVKQQYADILRLADNIFIQELHNHNLYDKTSQAFVVFLPVKSVGVIGDMRRYDYVVSLRAVETIDFMTAAWARLPYDFLDIVSNRIINEIPNISRVVYDISGKPPATIEWE